VKREKAWLLVGIIRSFEHLVFERTLDKEKSIFEFFVPADLEHYFLELMKYFEQQNIISNFRQVPNRLENEGVNNS
jgi:hypothetical protein